MKKETLIAFLDILGCSSVALHGTDKEKENIVSFLQKVNETYLSNQGVVVRDLGLGQQIIHKPEIFSCSDSILLSVTFSDPISQEELSIVANFMSTMVSIYWLALHHGLLIRGGVSRGECIHSANQIFGEAYVRAVKLEKSTCYPRIEIDAGVFSPKLQTVIDKELKSVVVKEIDGRFYLDSLRWHQGVWVDYMFFKYGQTNWPNQMTQIDEITKAIVSIELNAETKIKKLKCRANEKWRWFSEQWHQEKTLWPISA